MTVGIPQQDLNLAVVEIENEVKGKPLSEVLTVHAACDAAAEPVRESTSSHDLRNRSAAVGELRGGYIQCV